MKPSIAVYTSRYVAEEHNMSLYQNAFGKDFKLGFNLADYPFLIDQSYSNDMCPSFYFKSNSTYYILWVDHENPAEREDENNHRYTIFEAENLGDDDFPELQTKGDSDSYLETDSVTSFINYLSGVRWR